MDRHHFRVHGEGRVDVVAAAAAADFLKGDELAGGLGLRLSRIVLVLLILVLLLGALLALLQLLL